MSSPPPVNQSDSELHLLVLRGLIFCCHVNSKPLNSGLQAWCLLVGHVQSTISEPTGAQIQSTFADPCGLAAKLIRLPLILCPTLSGDN